MSDIWNPKLGEKRGVKGGKIVRPPQSMETLVEGPRGAAGEKVGLPWAESLLGEASG